MNWPLLACALICLAACPTLAQERPVPGPSDPRLQTVVYDPNQIVQLKSAPGYQLTLELSPDEQIQNVAVGDSVAWQVTANKAGDRLFLRPTQPGVVTNMTVVTTARSYNFDLIAFASPAADMAYIVRFTYPGAEPATAAPTATASILRGPSRYRIAGNRALRPAAVSDDGLHTYVTWAADAAIPATFQLGDDGQERLVNGAMRGGRFVVDGIARRLIFRIDTRIATATRLPPKKAK